MRVRASRVQQHTLKVGSEVVMLRTKKLAVGGVIALLAVTIVIAGSAHFIKCSKSTQGNNVVVSFKEAGLGNERTCITVEADASAVYACINGGGKNPSAANKRTINSRRTATDCFTPHNGSISGSLSLTPPGPGSFSCPPGQSLRLLSVSYSNVSVHDTTHNVSCTP
jgi:hypothetical protein